MRCWTSAGIVVTTPGVPSAPALTARAHGSHGTFGEAAAPTTPFTRGGFPQPAAIKSRISKTGWTSLCVSDIIPNTLCSPVMLVRDEGFVRRFVALHFAIQIGP